LWLLYHEYMNSSEERNEESIESESPQEVKKEEGVNNFAFWGVILFAGFLFFLAFIRPLPAYKEFATSKLGGDPIAKIEEKLIVTPVKEVTPTYYLNQLPTSTPDPTLALVPTRAIALNPIDVINPPPILMRSVPTSEPTLVPIVKPWINPTPTSKPRPIPTLAYDPKLQYASYKDRIEALALFNYYRSLAGIPLVTEDPSLSYGAQLHAHYLFVNIKKMLETKADLHSENPAYSAYSDEGNESAHKSNIAFEQDLKSSVKVLFFFDPLHRYWMQNPRLHRTGFGFEQQNADVDVNGTVIDEWNDWPVIFPAPNQSDVPLEGGSLGRMWGGHVHQTCFDGRVIVNEPQHGGFPIMLQFDSFSNPAPTLTSAFIETGGKQLSYIYCLPRDNEGFSYIGVYAKQPFTLNTTYHVKVSGIYKSKIYQKEWSFRTAADMIMTNRILQRTDLN
jgi:hypothetical protein